MADKRISQLADRGTVANNDVVAIVVNGAVTTNKATISSIQTFMQGNLDLGVTSVGFTLTQTDGQQISVTGSPITSSGNITLNLPRATNSIRGLLDSEDFINFSNKQSTITLTTSGTSGAATLVSNTLNIPNYAQDLSGFVTLATAQTITAQKTITTNGGSDTFIVNHTSGSGIGVNITKGGNGEGLIVNKTSGSGNAATITGTLQATTIVRTGGTSSQFLKADGSVDSTVYYPNSNPSGFTTNVGTVTSVSGTGTVSGLTLSGTVTSSGNLTLGGTLSLTSNNVTTALGFTPYNATNPSGFTSNVGTVTSVSASAGTGISISGSPITSSGTLNITNTAPDQVVSLTASTGISVSGSYPNFTITNTSPSSGGTVTNVTASAPLASSGGATPNLSITQASGSTNGFLSSTDWNTFNNKAPSVAGGYLPLSGGTLTGPLNGTSAVFSGAVGINGSPGTSFPLEVYLNSSTAHTTSSRGNVFRVFNTNTTANTYAGIEFVAEGTANTGVAGINAVVTGSGSAALSFYTRDASTFLERLRIASTGAATFSSSVMANGAKPQLSVIGDGGNGAGIILNTLLSGANRRNWGIFTEENIEGDFAIKCSTAAGGSAAAGDTRFSILNNGNVGIGTATPALVNFGREFVVSNTTGAQPEAQIVIQGNRTTDSNVGGFQFFNDTNFLANISGARDGANNSGIIKFSTNNAGSSAERMRITSGGNVEIATGSIKTGNPTGSTAQPFKVGPANFESDKSFQGNILIVEVNGVIYRLMIAE